MLMIIKERILFLGHISKTFYARVYNDNDLIFKKKNIILEDILLTKTSKLKVCHKIGLYNVHLDKCQRINPQIFPLKIN